MKIKTLFARGFDETLFWKFYSFAQRHKGILKSIGTLLYMRIATRQAGYIGRGTILKGCPHLPHGFHGVHLSMDAIIGYNVTIYQNVTIGRAHDKAPIVGDNCIIGCNSVILGGGENR